MNNYMFLALEQELIEMYLPVMYDILYTNMNQIAPTGNTYEEDKDNWTSCVRPAWEEKRRKVILIFKGKVLAGFFQYYVSATTFMMDEIQFKPEYQGSGIFTELYRYMIKIIPAETQFTEAYANKYNLKSQAILKHLGLEVIGKNKNGNSYNYKGDYKVLFDRYSKIDIAYCGLACCVCSENDKCVGCQSGGCDIHGWCKNFNCCREKGLNGCWECDEFPCHGTMLDKPRIRAFARFAKEYGTDELTKCLLCNKENGIVYHYEGQLVGDYDNCETKEEIIEMIKHGFVSAKQHYDLLIDENNDPVLDSKPLQDYMDKWDGQAFIDELQLSKDKSVLEIGVGTGRLAVKVAPQCGKFTGIDLSPKTIERAKENLAEHKNAKLICDDFMTHEFNEQFDVIYSSLTFMHISDKLTAINKVATLLAPSGRFILSIDKNQEEFIEAGFSKVKVYPDNPDEICGYLKAACLKIEKQFETELAYIFVAVN